MTATFHGAIYATAEFRYADATVGGTPSYDSTTGITTLTYIAPDAALDSIRSYDAYFKGALADCPRSQPEVTKVALVEILSRFLKLLYKYFVLRPFPKDNRFYI